MKKHDLNNLNDFNNFNNFNNFTEGEAVPCERAVKCFLAGFCF